ncbi:MAG: dienelactone hydrolase family protein [Caulobacterales bacterium]
MSGQKITIQAKDGGSFGAYVAKPASGSGPAIVVIQEIFGVNPWIRAVADQYAAQGFVAVAPDLFWRIRPGIELNDRDPDELQQAFGLFGEFDVAKGVEDIQATIDAARKLSTGKVGAVGFCLGGMLAYLTAARTNSDATASYYGVALDNFLGEAASIKTPTILHIAGEDKFVSKEAQERINSGLKGNPLVTLYNYPGMEHAFARTNGEHYSEKEAKLADKRTLDFFNTNLK